MSGYLKQPNETKPVAQPDTKLNDKIKEILFFGAEVAIPRLGNDPVGERLKRLIKTIENIHSRIDRLMGE